MLIKLGTRAIGKERALGSSPFYSSLAKRGHKASFELEDPRVPCVYHERERSGQIFIKPVSHSSRTTENIRMWAAIADSRPRKRPKNSPKLPYWNEFFRPSSCCASFTKPRCHGTPLWTRWIEWALRHWDGPLWLCVAWSARTQLAVSAVVWRIVEVNLTEMVAIISELTDAACANPIDRPTNPEPTHPYLNAESKEAQGRSRRDALPRPQYVQTTENRVRLARRRSFPQRRLAPPRVETWTTRTLLRRWIDVSSPDSRRSK